MFLVTNITKADIVIDDLHVSISPKKTIDLDKVCPRHRADISKPLHNALQKGILRILQKDSNIPQEEKIVRHVYEKDDLNALSAKVKELEKKLADKQSSPDIALLAKKIDELGEKWEPNRIPNPVPARNVPNTKNDAVVNPNALKKIHAQTIKRITKGMEEHIEQKDDVKSINITDRANELEKLL
jgi:hypothetical protein